MSNVYTAPQTRYSERDIPTEMIGPPSSVADYESGDPMAVGASIARSREVPGEMIGPPTAGSPEEMARPVVIGQEEWKKGPAGPVPTGGRGIYLTGGKPFVGQPLAPWTIEQMAREREEEQQQNIRELLQNVPPNQQAAMMERAVRLQGMFGFQSALQRGEPFMQAYARFVPQIYYNAPQAEAQAMRQLTGPTQKPAFVPTATSVGGQNLIQVSPNQFQVIPTPKTVSEIKPETMLKITRDRINSFQKDFDSTFDKAEKAAIRKKIDSERAEEEKLLGEIRKKKPTGPVGGPAPVAVGQVYKGYRFKGGDPSNQQSWEKVQ